MRFRAMSRSGWAALAAGWLLAGCGWTTAKGPNDAVPEQLPDKVRIHLTNDSTFLVTGAVSQGDSVLGLWQPVVNDQVIGVPQQRAVGRIQVSQVEIHARRPVMLGVAAVMVAGFAVLLAVQ
jgi:hypothetical protein